MGLLDRMKKPSIDERAAEAGEVGALLVDVRTPAEFRNGHIPGAINVPLATIDDMGSRAQPDDVLYLYCASGVRSSQACRKLKAAGFANAVNIGGIGSYRGPLER